MVIANVWCVDIASFRASVVTHAPVYHRCSDRAILHDPLMFPNPDAFNPERWLKASDAETEESPAPIHPLKVALGFGRRYVFKIHLDSAERITSSTRYTLAEQSVCPGRYLAYNSVSSIICFSRLQLNLCIDIPDDRLCPFHIRHPPGPRRGRQTDHTKG